MRLFTLFLFCIGLFTGGCNPCFTGSCCDVEAPGLQVIDTLELRAFHDYSTPFDTTIYYEFSSIGKELYIAGYHPLIGQVPSESKPGWQLFPAAYACSPVTNAQATSYFKEINIIANTAINYEQGRNWQTGDTINPYFTIQSSLTHQELDIAAFLNSHDRIFVEDYFILKAKSSPQSQLELKFDLNIVMVDGKTFHFPDQTLRIK